MVVVPAPAICTKPSLLIVATEVLLLAYVTGMVVLVLVAAARKSALPYVFTGMAAKLMV
jgi:hypothetical protein